MSAGCAKEWPLRAVCVNVHVERTDDEHRSGAAAPGPSCQAASRTCQRERDGTQGRQGKWWHHNANDICFKEWQRESGYR